MKNNEQFKSIEEFNEVWLAFEKEYKRQKWHMPPCSSAQQKGMVYTQTRRFQWIVETFKLWEDYKKRYFQARI